MSRFGRGWARLYSLAGHGLLQRRALGFMAKGPHPAMNRGVLVCPGTGPFAIIRAGLSLMHRCLKMFEQTKKLTSDRVLSQERVRALLKWSDTSGLVAVEWDVLRVSSPSENLESDTDGFGFPEDFGQCCYQLTHGDVSTWRERSSWKQSGQYRNAIHQEAISHCQY